MFPRRAQNSPPVHSLPNPRLALDLGLDLGADLPGERHCCLRIISHPLELGVQVVLHDLLDGTPREPADGFSREDADGEIG